MPGAVQLKLKPSEAKVILAANVKNMDSRSKRILQKVVDKSPLSDDEIGELEGIVAAGRLELQLLEGKLEDKGSESAAELRNTFEHIEANMERRAKILDRRRIVMEWRCQHPPVPIKEICKRLNVCIDTVMNDIKRIKESHERAIDASTSIRILGQTVEQYDVLHGKAMHLVDQYSSPMAKAALLRTAISALDSKARLMGETGIIHRVPERQEILVAHADAGTVKERVAKLIHAQEQRTSKTLELPAPKPDDLQTTQEAQLIEEDLKKEIALEPAETPAPNDGQ